MPEATQAKTAIPVLRHYVIWYGPVYSEIYDVPVESRDPNSYLMEKGGDYFRIYDRLELEWEHGGVIHRLRSEPFNYSPYYVPGGRLLTPEECDTAFANALRPFANSREKYQPISTRYRFAEPLSNSIEVVFLPEVQMTYEPQLNESIHDIVKSMIKLADENGCKVVTEFKGVAVEARPRDFAPELISRYNAEVDRIRRES